ncbi:MAG TPA: radical SAM protein [Kofleriaceae bacterium]|jgi:oxygen-independent coproporphyrinogen-3 oxidase|nr:radical SAM protein [Kofleriaceae bacterium]
MEAVDKARKFLDHNLHERQNVVVVHGFPSVLAWDVEEVPVAEILEDRKRQRGAGLTKTLDLYLGIPYCPKTKPAKCGYCLFPVEDYTGNPAVETYFEYLQREGELYRALFDDEPLYGIFFGGGTSNLYRADKYPQLMDMVRRIFPRMAPGAEITLEGLPALFTREKLDRIKEAGMTRISMGAQQMNDELNQLSGRKQTARHVLQCVEWARERGLGCNVDLIFGWPRQTVATMVGDLELLISSGVEDITHYELHIGGPTDFAVNRRDELPSPAQNLELYRVSRDLLTSHGFRQVTAYNWRKVGVTSGFEEGVEHDFDGLQAWGWGYAAASFFTRASASGEAPGWLFKNATTVQAYKAALDAGRFPVERGYRCAPEDVRLASLFRHLHGMRVDRAAYRVAFARDVVEEFAGIWQALEERGLVAIDADEIRVIGDGVFYTPTIQGLLGLARYQELRTALYKKHRKLATIQHILGSS